MEKHLSQHEIAFVRETMIKQQAMYYEQVQELHRLYEVQRTLLEEGSRNNSGSLKDFLKVDVSKGPSTSNWMKKEPDKQGSQPKRRFRFNLEKLPDEQSDEEDGDVEEAAGTSYGFAEPASAAARTLFTSGGQRHSQMKQDNLSNAPHWLSQVLEKTRNGCWNTRNNAVFQQETNQLQSAPQNGLVGDLNFFASSKDIHKLLPPKQEAEKRVENRYPSWTLIAASNNCEYPVYSPVQATWSGLQRGFCSQQNQQASLQHFYKPTSAIHPWQAGTPGHLSMAAPSSTFRLNGVLQDGHWLQGNFTLTTPGIEGSFKVSYPGLTDRFQKEAQVVYKNGYHDLEKLHKLGDTRKQDADNRSRQSNDGQLGKAVGFMLSEEEAANILVFMSSRRDTNPTTELENSVAWFAEAIPTMSQERESKKQEQEGEVDEFELATLQLKPVTSLYCVTTTPAKPVNVVEAVEVASVAGDSYAAARPKRRCNKKMDFQRETLPSIASLSRHEITEDLQVMGGLVRSTATARESSGGWEVAVAHHQHHQACQRRKSGAKCSPVSTLDVSRSPKRRSSAACAAGGFKVASWGSRRKRNQERQRRTWFGCFSYLGALSASVSPISFRNGCKQR